jgi:hypothetical protein
MMSTDPTTPETPQEPEVIVVESEVVEPDGAVVDETVVEEVVSEEPAPLIEPEPAPAPPPVEAVIVEDEVIVAEVVDEPAAPPAPPAPPAYDAAAATATATPTPPPAAPQVVYVQPVMPPKKLHNRGIGSLLALGATVVFAAALAGATWLLGWFTEGSTTFAFLGAAKFWLPVGVFLVAFVLLVLLANRANWWAYILGSVFVAIGVYFGTIALALAFDTILRVPAPSTFGSALVSPFVIIAAIIAREVSMWFGSILARRGRKLKVRNAEARAAYEREAAERRAATGY